MADLKTVLIIGGSGFVGTHLALHLRKNFKVFSTYYSRATQLPGVTNIPFNLKDDDWIKRMIYSASPDVVIYCAGSNDLVDAVKDPRSYDRMHVSALEPVLKASTIFQPRFIYISNSFVFDGTRGNYREVDTVLASTELGKFKVAGENFVRGRALNFVLVRSSPLFGRGNGDSFTLLDRLRLDLSRKKKIPLDNSHIHNFGLIDLFVEFVTRLIEVGPKNRPYHFGGLTKCTQLEFGKHFATRFGYDPNLIVPSGRAATDSDRDFSLNSTDSIKILGTQPILLDEAFNEFEKRVIQRMKAP